MTHPLYRPMTEDDIPLVLAWHRLPHVRHRFGDDPDDERREELKAMLQAKGFELSLMLWHGAPVGYIQVYRVYKLAADIYGIEDREGTFATDQFIGAPAALRQGVTSRVLRAVIAELFARPGTVRVVTDPSADNRPAIGAYLRAGFRLVPGHRTGEGELLMVAGREPALKAPIPMPEDGDDWDED